MIEPLALPEGDAGPGEIESSPAVQLLRDRVGAVPRDLVVDAHWLSTMVRVCRALDGMPLAIELAAATSPRHVRPRPARRWLGWRLYG